MRRRTAGRLRALIFGLAALVVGGCAGDDAPWGGPPRESVSARFESLSDVIVVTVVDRLPLRSAELVAPDGERVAAYSLDVRSSPVVAASPESTVFMATPGVPQQVTRIGVMSSTALIQLPDAGRYAKDWRDWRVELRIGNAGDVARDMTLAAPKPPR